MEQQVLAALLDPAAYPEPTHQVQLVQTHVSYLFITDAYVYKVKKAVDLGFLNFTDLGRRHFFCAEEVRLNTRLCPGMYLGVVAVRKSATGFQIGGAGEVVEYAVKMKRLPAERMLNILLDTDAVSVEEIRAIARIIAEFHRTAKTDDEIARYGLPDAICSNWAENFRQMKAFIPALLSQQELQRVEAWVASFMKCQDALLRQRVAAGFIRDGDGDIHCDNICLAEQIWVFDCIEFNQRFRFADTAADLAFLLMDLDYHGRPDLAEVALATYTAITGDDVCRELQPFYKLYRAVVRAKVEALRSMDLQCTATDRQHAAQRARDYMRLARGLIVRQELPPTLLLMCGLMGCGKSTLARTLAFELGLPVIRSDVLRKELLGIPPTTRVDAAFSTSIYGDDMSRRTYTALADRAAQYLATGTSVIVDASFSSAREREHFVALAESLHVPQYLLYLRGSDDLLLQRLQTRTTMSNDASDGRAELYWQQKQLFSSPVAADFVVSLDATKTPEQLVTDVYGAMNLADW